MKGYRHPSQVRRARRVGWRQGHLASTGRHRRRCYRSKAPRSHAAMSAGRDGQRRGGGRAHRFGPGWRQRSSRWCCSATRRRSRGVRPAAGVSSVPVARLAFAQRPLVPSLAPLARKALRLALAAQPALRRRLGLAGHGRQHRVCLWPARGRVAEVVRLFLVSSSPLRPQSSLQVGGWVGRERPSHPRPALPSRHIRVPHVQEGRI